MNNSMPKLRFVALDDTAVQALEMANLTRHSEIVETEESLQSGTDSRIVTVFVISRLDDTSLQTINMFRGRGIVLFPEPERMNPLVESVLKSLLIPIPVKLETLATFSFSQAAKTVETLFIDSSDQDFMLGNEDLFEVLQPHIFNRFYHAEGRHLREAVLRMAHRVRSQRRLESVAYTLLLPSNTTLFALDEALDVLEVAVPPEKPLVFAIRFGKEVSRVKISACIAAPMHLTSGIQSRIDAQPTYLGKVAVIVDSFAMGEIDERKMLTLSQDNGIDPEDADRLYEMIYVRADETAGLMRHLRESRSGEERIEAVARALADGSIDVKILEELTALFGLSADAIVARANTLRQQDGR
ncbi:hypothetical protein [Hydrogenimonas sp.]|uniref:hypothetical protein n=1 Tax=Hydrogenimonas sp. TaxID=2231112 RepID=UPI00262FB265|nr:hypothetical protein [Hydrogenimonas sp.]